VTRNDIDRIREKIRLRQYDMSAHAMEEMAEDLLTILDPTFRRSTMEKRIYFHPSNQEVVTLTSIT
jgi:hypothetical protein